jgi:DNA-binding beta-propeller fold protein YncE
MRRLAVVAASAPLALLGACAGSVPNPSRALLTSVCPPPAASALALTRVRTASVPVPGNPSSVVVSSAGRWSFVTLPGAVAVMSNAGFAPRLVRLVPIPALAGDGAHGLALADRGRYLLAGAGGGAVVIDVRRAERRARAVLGFLNGPVSIGQPGDPGAGAVVASRDGRYVFVARERAGGVAVFDLARALASGLRRSGLLGVVPVDLGPSAMALGPSGRRLYVTSVAAAPPPGATLPVTGAATGASGRLDVIDAAVAVRRPRRSILSSVSAGCEPVDVAASPDGRTVWVATLSDHAVIGFASGLLVRRPGSARIALVRVGSTPTGVLPFAGGRRLLVSYSGRSGADGAPGVAVIDTARALAGRRSLLGSVTAGADPRRLALVPGRRRALVTDYGSSDVEAIDLTTVP